MEQDKQVVAASVVFGKLVQLAAIAAPKKLVKVADAGPLEGDLATALLFFLCLPAVTLAARFRLVVALATICSRGIDFSAF
jgi:hypothetical protein